MFFIPFFLETNLMISDFFKKTTDNLLGGEKLTQAVENSQKAINGFRENSGQAVEEFFSNTENYLRDFTAQNFPDLGSKLSPMTTTLMDWKIAIGHKLEQFLSNSEKGIINDLVDKTSIFLEDTLSRTGEAFSQWKTNLVDALYPILSNREQTLNHLVTETTNFLEPKLAKIKYFISDSGAKLEKFWQSASQWFLDNLGNPDNWNVETIGRAIEKVFFTITQSIFFIVEQSIKGICQGISSSVHDIWGIAALIVIGLFIIIMIVRWQFVR